jgi:hypothetical protein
MVNFPAIWVYTQIRTKLLSMSVVVAAPIALCLRKHSALQWALAPSLLVWATTIRVTNGVALAAVCLLVVFQLRHAPRKLLATGGIVALNGIVSGLPMLAFPRESIFHISVS